MVESGYLYAVGLIQLHGADSHTATCPYNNGPPAYRTCYWDGWYTRIAAALTQWNATLLTG